jgi:hypothetical protein
VPERPEAPPNEIEPLFKALANEERILILAQTIRREATAEEIVAATGIASRSVAGHLGHLRWLGLLDAEGDPPRFRFNRGPLVEAMKVISQQSAGVRLDDDLDAFDRKVLTTFLVDGRLISIPAHQKKRDAVLRFLAGCFEPDRMYDEREVNAILREYHPDVASLRRYLVDGGFLARQVVRVASMEQVIGGAPALEPHLTYWRPSEGMDS